MKISLISIKSQYNYGAALQSYATYQYLKNLNHSVEVVNYFPKRSKNIKGLIIDFLTIQRRFKIKSFYRKNMEFTKIRYKSFKQIEDKTPEADIYIVGSDQVWNSQIYGGKLDPAFFLDFVDDKKKISFASSIGRDDVNADELKEMKHYLNKFNNVSVREESAKVLLEEAGLREVKTVLDPVFLLEQKDYEKFIKPVSIKKYLLIYTFEKNSLIEKIAKDVSKRLGLKIIELGTYMSKYSSFKFINNAGVEDFVSLIYHADFIVTSSFHGTAFSILFNKQFIAVAPSVRRTRLENIANLLGVKERLVTEKTNYSIDELLKSIDYNNVNELLKNNAEDGRAFLKNSTLNEK